MYFVAKTGGVVMKKFYENPELMVVLFCDVITTSNLKGDSELPSSSFTPPDVG